MTDTFLFLTPVLVLGIVALLGFVGCAWALGLPEFPPTAPTPTISPPAGAYYAPQMITLEDPDADEMYYYLVDPADPTSSASTTRHPYTGPFQISRSVMVDAYGSKTGYSDSDFKARYYIGPIFYQQGPAETSGAAGGMTTQAFPNPLGQSNLVLVWVFYQTNSPAVQLSTMTDGVNQYAPAGVPLTSPFTPMYKQEIWYANKISPVPNATITVSFSGGIPGEVQISAHEYTNNYQESDGPLANPVPTGTTGTDTNTPGNLVSSPTVTTNGRLAFGAALFEGSGVFQPPWVSRSTIRNNVVEDMDITAPGGDVTALFVNTSPTQGWMAQIITLK